MNSGWQEQTSCCSTGNRLTRGWDGAPDWEKMKSNGSRSTGRVKSPCGSDGLRQSRAWIFLVWHCQRGGSESTDREEERSEGGWQKGSRVLRQEGRMCWGGRWHWLSYGKLSGTRLKSLSRRFTTCINIPSSLHTRGKAWTPTRLLQCKKKGALKHVLSFCPKAQGRCATQLVLWSSPEGQCRICQGLNRATKTGHHLPQSWSS